jgi:ATP-dependent Clp protease ATP-binding subunit ClpC
MAAYVYPFERFTTEAKGVLTLAQEEAERSQHSYIGTEHLVIGLIRQDGLAARALVSLGQNTETLREAIREVADKKKEKTIQSRIPTSRVKRVIEMAFEDARRQGSSHVGTEHLLLAILMEGDGVGAQVLAERGVTVDKVRAEVDRLQAAGVKEQLAEPPGEPAIGGRRHHRHFEVADAQGRAIEVDVVFPPEYSDEECQAVIDRIKSVFPPGPP